MTIRNILDYQGNVLGTLELPDSATDAQWAAALAAYSTPPPDALTVAKLSIRAAMDFGMELIAEFGALSVVNGLNTSQVATMAAKLASVQALLVSGSLHTAILAIQAVATDSYITQAVKDDFCSRITAYLGSNS